MSREEWPEYPEWQKSTRSPTTGQTFEEKKDLLGQQFEISWLAGREERKRQDLPPVELHEDGEDDDE